MLTFCNMFLCAMAALVLAAQAARVSGGIRWWLAGFCGGVLLLDSTLAPAPIGVQPEQSAMLLLLIATFLLLSPSRMLWLMPAGGLLAVLWAGALQAQGLSSVLAWLVVVAALATSFYCGKTRIGFCPPGLLREVLVVQLAAASLVVVVPGFIAGWGAGMSLSSVGTEPFAPPDALSAIAVTAICFVGGITHSLFGNHVNKRSKSL